MRILVTGGAGFIGSRIVHRALGSGWQVRVLDSLRPDVHGTSLEIPSGIEFIRADITNTAALLKALHGVDVVSHQAAKVGLGVDFADAPDYVASNELGTAVLLAAMNEIGVRRLVLASSMVVYGEGAYSDAHGGPGTLPQRPSPRLAADLEAGQFDPVNEHGTPLTPELIDEDSILDPRNVYATSKLSQEFLARSWARATGSAAIALRYHNVYGPGMPQNTPYAGVASLFRSAIDRGEAPRVFEDGRQRRDFIHVEDVASANVAAIQYTEAAEPGWFRAFNVGSGEMHTIGDMASALSQHSGGKDPVITGEYRLGDVRHITASSERARRELGWSAAVSFENGMREFATSILRPAVAASPRDRRARP